jgi:hypothetical protein
MLEEVDQLNILQVLLLLQADVVESVEVEMEFCIQLDQEQIWMEKLIKVVAVVVEKMLQLHYKVETVALV